MACIERTYSATKAVWSRGSTSVGVFVPFFQVDATAFRSARASYRLTADKAITSNCDVEVRPQYAISNDGATWPTSIAFGPAASSTLGWHYGSDFDTLVTDGRQLLFGVRVVNTSGTAIRGALVELRVELKGD